MPLRNFIFLVLLAPSTFYSIASVQAEVIFTDDFESGDLNKSMNGFQWTQTNTMTNDDVTVATGIAHSGNSALKFHFSGVPDGADNWAEQRYYLGSQYTHLFMSFWIYYPDGTEPGENAYIHRDSDGTDNNKLWRMWDTDYVDGDIHLGYSTQLGPNGGDTFFEKHHAEAYLEPKISEYSTYDVGWYNGGSNLGKWHFFEFEVKLNTPGVLDGITRMWVNGTLMHEMTDANYSDLGQGPTNFIQYGYLMGWANSGFTQDTNVYIDDITFSTTRLSAIVKPMPPTIVDNP